MVRFCHVASLVPALLAFRQTEPASLGLSSAWPAAIGLRIPEPGLCAPPPWNCLADVHCPPVTAVALVRWNPTVCEKEFLSNAVLYKLSIKDGVHFAARAPRRQGG